MRQNRAFLVLFMIVSYEGGNYGNHDMDTLWACHDLWSCGRAFGYPLWYQDFRADGRKDTERHDSRGADTLSVVARHQYAVISADDETW